MMIHCKNIAILINGTSGDYNIIYLDPVWGLNPEARNWFDLFMAYEYLIEKAGYEHENIYVFSGDGTSWNPSTGNYRYHVEEKHPEWGISNMVDFEQSETSIEQNISIISSNLNEYDNLLIWIVGGHGIGSKDEPNCDNFTYNSVGDSGWVLNENDDEIYELFHFTDENENPKYKRCKILWSSCFSGHLLVGNKTLLNRGNSSNVDDEKMIVFTSASYNQVGIISSITYANKSESHSGFTYSIYSSLNGEDPYGNALTISDPNNDGVLNLTELWEAINSNTFQDISWNNTTSLQRGDPCPKSDYIYIDEILKLRNRTLSLVSGESIRYYRVDQVIAGENLIIPENSNIEFVVDTKVKLKSKFHAESGSRFHAYFGEIECSH